jgi:single-stranded DNA-binding protein
MGMNSVNIVGVVETPPILRTASNNAMFCSFLMGVFTGKQKFLIPITVWDNQAELLMKYVKKDDPLAVSGKLVSKPVALSDGTSFSAVSIVSLNITFLKHYDESDQKDKEREGLPANFDLKMFEEAKILAQTKIRSKKPKKYEREEYTTRRKAKAKTQDENKEAPL